jgi:superfamily I DNA and/or RNA helicase
MEVLTGRMKVNNDVAEHLWNTFFFCVPVVSTTLASAGSLFSQMGPESIGWLLIDEAGQATPQSAVGLIYRSRRCIAVGDPLQIEPVVTHPQKLVELIRLETGVKETLWSPLESSVQSLADRISLHGTMLKTDDTVTWSGFPLRAHRRCDDPMFSISNRIAYNGQMVKATDNPLYQCEIGQSCWFHFAGIDLKDKHVLLEEVKILEWLLTKLVAEDTEREVYVISPFVSVAEHCEKRFKKRKQRVTCGTIHAFQGREADIVLLVLGGNPDKLQAREWVTRNPNMINVAVTRAKHLFFIIGNHKLWGDLPFLRQVNGLMPIINFDMNNVK